MPRPKTSRLSAAIDALKRFFKRKPNPPEDPYAYVTAPQRPRTPSRTSSAVAELPDE